MSAQPDQREGEAVALAVQALRAFGRLRLRADGSSMLPNVHPGDVLDFNACTHAQAEAGEVVLVRRGDRLVIHRVLMHTADGLLTQGDGLPRPDAPVRADDVLGRLVGQRRSGRAIATSRPGRLGMTRWLFGHSSLAARLFLRWHRASNRASA